jgi:hypothetical protein
MAEVGTASPAGSLAALVTVFNDQIATLRQAADLRNHDMKPHATDLAELEVQVLTQLCFCSPYRNPCYA